VGYRFSLALGQTGEFRCFSLGRKAMREYNIYDAPLREGDRVELVYPSSADGSPLPRKGVVERIGNFYVVVEVAEGTFRTFRFDRIVGGTVKID